MQTAAMKKAAMVNRVTHNQQRGLTLVELLIVIGIVGVLAALAIPAYSEYTIRSQVAEGLSLATSAKNAVNEFYAQNGTVPADRDATGLGAIASDTSGKYVQSVSIVNGRIDVAFGNDVNRIISGRTLSLTPYESPDRSIAWRCALAAAPADTVLLGTGSVAVSEYFAGTLAQLDGGKYLPGSCRTGS